MQKNNDSNGKPKKLSTKQMSGMTNQSTNYVFNYLLIN